MAPRGLRWKPGSVRRPDDVAWQGDRWIEALLGARMRFHLNEPVPVDEATDGGWDAWQRYWAAIYRRWQRLYVAGRDNLIAGWDEDDYQRADIEARHRAYHGESPMA